MDRYGEDYTAQHVADTYESMQAAAAKKAGGVYYTPQPLGEFMSVFSLKIALQQVGDDAAAVLNVLALDPACGTGMILVEGARFLAARYAGRLVSTNPSADLVDAVMPAVVLSCIFGMDIDPVAAELARICVSRLTGGAVTPAQLERHIIAANTLAGPDGPPAFEERRRSYAAAA